MNIQEIKEMPRDVYLRWREDEEDALASYLSGQEDFIPSCHLSDEIDYGGPMLRLTAEEKRVAVCEDTGAYIEQTPRRWILVFGNMRMYWRREGLTLLEVVEKAQVALDKLTGRFVQEDF